MENASPAGHGVAVYIFVGGWWTKPTSGNPLTPIQPDGAWACDITTGGDDAYATRVAAFLVPTNYAPPILLPAPTFPTDLLSNARASVDVARPYTRRLWFSGYEWSVKDSRGGRVGPGTNYFSDSNSNVWVDAAGRLHLALTPRAGGWNCAEVVSVRSFGVGTYRAVLDGAADALDREAVLGLFTWHDDAAHAHREMDVEVTRWGDAADTNNAQFVVQPYELPGHRVRYRVPPAATNSTHSFAWWPDRIDFTAHAGAYELPPLTGTPVAAWTFSAPGVPAPGGENLRFNLWLRR